MSQKIIKGYTLENTEYIKEIDGTVYLYTHDKTKAKVMYIANEDPHKSFGIGFRTPPSDSTGVPHIIEHSVLCGSRKFPLKDPFVELAKGSLNTYLNAMTYPDKTLYPISSQNDTDFHNLMDVYLDAVFFPNIYKNKYILMQEGWRYHLESEEAPLEYKGVVYNEMKGAFSSPEEVIFRKIKEVLFPNSTYCNESGGAPEHITDLTYK
ncbi:MAG: insulinase family protein, partial [Cellulosilyticaceae bacterium]